MSNNVKKIILGVAGGIILLFAIDLICIFTINRPLLAIKQDDNDPVGIYYRGLLYNTVLCHESSKPQIYLKGFGVGCPINSKNNESTYTPTEIKNVSISISDISLTGATIIIKDTNNNPYTYGEWYKLEKQVDGKWYDVKTIIENYGFNSIVYLPDKNNEVKFDIDWEWLYGELPLGSYRILKGIDNKYISVEFSIVTSSKEKTIKPNLFARSEIIKVAIDNYSQYKNNFEYTDKKTIDNIYNLLKDLETNVASKSDEPENPEELYKITFFNDENMLLESDNDIFKAIIYVYRKNNKYYVEEQKNGIYEITKEDFDIIRSYIK